MRESTAGVRQFGFGRLAMRTTKAALTDTDDSFSTLMVPCCALHVRYDMHMSNEDGAVPLGTVQAHLHAWLLRPRVSANAVPPGTRS
jgi:hypothetical protein